MTNGLELLLPEPEEERDSFRFAVVTRESPLQIRLMGESSPVPDPPASLAKVRQGDHVYVLIRRRQMIIVGVVGGTFRDDIDALGSENLNNLITNGTYVQRASANATSARNYPLGMAGYLEVFRGGGGSQHYVMQRYTEYRGRSVWLRTKYQDTWYDWVAMYDDTPPSAGRRTAVRSQNIPTSTITRLEVFGSSGDDLSGGVSAVSTYGLRLAEPGWYMITGGMRWQDSSSSTQMRAILDGTMVAFDMGYPADAGGVTNSVSTAVKASANALVYLDVYTTAARSTNTATTFMGACHLSAVKLD